MTLPLLLVASALAHGFLFGLVAFSSSFGSSPQAPSNLDLAPALTIIFPKPTPVRPAAAPAPPAKSSVARPLAANALVPPLPAPPQLSHPLTKAPPVALAREANPNANIPPVAPDSVLAPVPAPKLDGTKGVVFILDISGSMYESFAGSTRLALARQELSRRVRALPDGTPFAVVLYAMRACASGPLVAANEATRAAAVRFLQRDMNCDGGTNLPAGLLAARTLNTGALVLATDGDLNISSQNLILQAREILGEHGTGPSLLVLGIAPRAGTIADHLLQDLADLEGGTYQVQDDLPDVTVMR